MSHPHALNRFERALGQVALFSHRYAWPLLSAVVILTVALTVYVVRNMAIHTDTDEMIDPNLDFRRTYQQFQQEFPQISDTFVIVLRSNVPEAADAARDTLFEHLANDQEHFSSLYAPGHGAFFSQNGLLFLDEDELSALADRLAAAQPVLAAMVEDPSLARFFDLLREGMEEGEEGLGANTLNIAFEALIPVFEAQNEGRTEPLSWARMFDPELAGDDDNKRFIIVQPKLNPSKLSPAKAALRAARDLGTEVQAASPAPLTIEYTGKIALNAEELKSVSEGAALAGILSMLLVAGILGFGLRSTKLVFATLIMLIIGLIWTAAFAIAAIGYLNIISVAFAVLFIGLGIDFGVHFALRYGEERGRGVEERVALFRTASTTGAALAICAPTTALAFFAFAPTSYVGLSQLGVISGTGIFISLLASLTVLPALLRVLPGRARIERIVHTNHANGFITNNGFKISLIGIGVGVLSIFLAVQVRFDADPIRLKDPTTASVQAYYRLVEDKDASPYVVQLMAQDAKQADSWAEELKDDPAVHRIVRFQSFVPQNQDLKLARIDEMALFLTPVLLGEARQPEAVSDADKAALVQFNEVLTDYAQNGAARRLSNEVSRYLSNPDASLEALSQAIFTYWPRAIDTLSQSMEAQEIDAGRVPDQLRERYISESGTYRLEIYPTASIDDETVLEEFVDHIKSIAPVATGSPVQIVDAGKVVKTAMLEATGLAALLVTAFLTLLLRDMRRVLLILIPIALAGALTLAASVLLPLPFNFANVIVLPLLIGLGVDSGIHLVSRAHEGDDADILDTSTPRAVLLSAATTLASFGTLAISSHQGTASMGALLFVAIFFTLICTLVILPGLIAALNGQKTVGEKQQ